MLIRFFLILFISAILSRYYPTVKDVCHSFVTVVLEVLFYLGHSSFVCNGMQKAVLKVVRHSVLKKLRADDIDGCCISFLLDWVTADETPVGIKLRLLQLLASVKHQVCMTTVCVWSTSSCTCVHFLQHPGQWYTGLTNFKMQFFLNYVDGDCTGFCSMGQHSDELQWNMFYQTRLRLSSSLANYTLLCGCWHCFLSKKHLITKC